MKYVAARTVSSDRDVVYTPPWIVEDMLSYFRPDGRILDPCRGRGAFHDRMPGSDWCEITDGRDFFDWSDHVDWVVGNPPYSIIRAWFRHSFTIADNLLYLIPIRSFLGGYGNIREAMDFGGVRAIRLYGTGGRCGFPMGNAVGAVHIQRHYDGPIHFTDQQFAFEETA